MRTTTWAEGFLAGAWWCIAGRARFAAEENILIGNVALYGATSARRFFNGDAGNVSPLETLERRPVSGGVGDSRLRVYDQRIGRGAGPVREELCRRHEGGIALCFDERLDFAMKALQSRCSVDLDPVLEPRMWSSCIDWCLGTPN